MAVLLLHRSWAHEWQNRTARIGWKSSLNWWHSRFQECWRCDPAWWQLRSPSLSPTVSSAPPVTQPPIFELSQGTSYKLYHRTDANLRVKRILYLGALKPTRPEHSTWKVDLDQRGNMKESRRERRSQRREEKRKITECSKQNAASTHSIWAPSRRWATWGLTSEVAQMFRTSNQDTLQLPWKYLKHAFVELDGLKILGTQSSLEITTWRSKFHTETASITRNCAPFWYITGARAHFPLSWEQWQLQSRQNSTQHKQGLNLACSYNHLKWWE